MSTNGYAKDVLVSHEWVSEHLDDPKVVVAEVDENTDLYDEGHIPGAVRLHWKDDLQDQLERDLIEKAEFEQLMDRRLRVLVPEDLRPRGRAHPRRRPPEVDRRGQGADDRCTVAAARVVHGA